MRRTTLVSLLALACLAPCFNAYADLKKPDGNRWYCVDRNGTRYCYRNGEACKLVKSQAGNYWVCDGPIKRDVRRIPVRTQQEIVR